MQSVLIDRAIDLAKSDPKQLADLGVAINKGAETMGLDMRTMELTEQGFVPSQKTGSNSVTPNATGEAQALSAMDAPDTPAVAGAPGQTALAANHGSEASKPFSYGLLAAAAAAGGVGGAIWMGRRRG